MARRVKKLSPAKLVEKAVREKVADHVREGITPDDYPDTVRRSDMCIYDSNWIPRLTLEDVSVIAVKALREEGLLKERS